MYPISEGNAINLISYHVLLDALQTPQHRRRVRIRQVHHKLPLQFHSNIILDGLKICTFGLCKLEYGEHLISRNASFTEQRSYGI